MDLVKSWLGQALRATGAAVVVPLAVIAALSLTALGGAGLGGLGSLSQIVSGPRVAGSDISVDDGDAEISDAVTQLAAAPPASGPRSGVDPAPRIPGGGGGDGGPTTPPGAAPPPGGGSPPGGGQPPTDNNGGGGRTPPPSEAPPGGTPDPGVVGGLGETVRGVTEGTPVAPTVEDAVDGLVETCGRLGCP